MRVEEFSKTLDKLELINVITKNGTISSIFTLALSYASYDEIRVYAIDNHFRDIEILLNDKIKKKIVNVLK